ncbi:MAG: CsgG/HfaB family protein [Bacteroidota bacterium]
MKYFYLFVLMMLSSSIHAEKYERSLQEIAQEIALLVEKRGFEKVAILNFQSINDSQEHVSKPLTEDFSVHFTNATHSLKIYDRQHIEALTNELKLQQSGLMAPQTAKKIGSFTGVEAIVIGNYAVHKNKVKLWIKVIETESAFQIAMKNALLPWQAKNYKSLNNEKASIHSSKINSPAKGKGKLKIINRKASHLRLILTNDEFSKEVKVGRKSAIEVLNIPRGIYSCEIYFQSGDLFQKFDVKVSKKMERIKIHGYSIFSTIY